MSCLEECAGGAGKKAGTLAEPQSGLRTSDSYSAGRSFQHELSDLCTASDMGAETGAQLVSRPWSDDGCGGTWGSIRAVRHAVFLEFTDFLGHFADRFVAVVGFFGHRFQADLFQT